MSLSKNGVTNTKYNFNYGTIVVLDNDEIVYYAKDSRIDAETFLDLIENENFSIVCPCEMNNWKAIKTQLTPMFKTYLISKYDDKNRSKSNDLL